MRSIFTRVFLSIWATLLLIAAGAVVITSLHFAIDHHNPEVVTRQAKEVLAEQGLEGLRSWLAARNARYTRQRTLVIGEDGRDILGQKTPRFLRVRRWAVEHGPPPEGRAPEDGRFADRLPRGLRDRIIRAGDGSAYVVAFDPPPRRGPFSPPFSWPLRLSLLALAIAISGGISFLLARSISSPLRRLQTAARTFATGDLSARTGAGLAARRDELGGLAREFDSMAERLSALIAARQQLLRDISHELRSPLARVQMALGLARQRPAEVASQLDRIERETERLAGLIGGVLDYARLERDPVTLAFEDIDLAEIARQIVHDAEFEFQKPGQVRFAGPDELSMRADAQLMHAAIDNVVRNALRHGATPVEIGIDADEAQVRIVVRDHGRGVPDADLARIFEPFYRVLTSTPPPGDGTGIGLAITARAIALHGGRVTARNAPDGGLEVTISLARRPASSGGARDASP